MSIPWDKYEYKIGINMAGAVSAGAYTAGVLDFLTEALEEWQKKKDAFRKHLNGANAAAPYADPVPLHQVTIEGFSGASAGGMCAAIASVMLQSQFDHITTPDATGTNNTFYEAWVNQIDISKLLLARDLEGGKPVVSLLDSSIIDDIAAGALKPPATLFPRPYVSEHLTLFLTTTNVRGMTYPLYGDADASVNEFTSFYGDRVRFETTRTGVGKISDSARALPVDQPKDPAWPFLQDTAKATGAFPLFLAPRVLTREIIEYKPPLWFPVGSTVPVPLPDPDFSGDPEPETIDTLNVDGGVTDNDPLELVHDYLACENPNHTCVNGAWQNPRLPEDANCSVITVAPFPSTDRWDNNFFAGNPESIFNMLPRLFSVLISQSRFLGESLNVLTSDRAFSRFVIAPSDPGQADSDALQCGTLSAFGGFMEQKFRAHDFLLGRYNCQRFLSKHFLLPDNNPVIAAGQKQAGSFAPAILKKFQRDAPVKDPGPGASNSWIPLIPLVGTAAVDIRQPVRQKISKARVRAIAALVMQRLDDLKGPLLEKAPVPLAVMLKLVLTAVTLFGKGKLEELLTQKLAPNVEGQ